ncbi:hypothetical protein MXMO3_00344 [Maritalea myrionectae]|uniref:HTH tetR-type domain-containing protein n=1 Tax=Maritalea myrionectae TaxID=454601 RepID=A0A2R4MA31_9HYPH|nr:TetR/AcrR family transcriptional regulator [Maritalea myrionectae]AVX02891.1 hypothetical protein MXMO3_00344 [Maritalea myrionectae]
MNLRVEGKQKRAQTTRAHILESFAGLMRQQSYDEISIAQIAAEAEVGKGTVLAHFSEKLALAATLFAEELGQCLIRTEAEPKLQSAAQLRRIFDPFFAFIMQDDVYIRLIVGEGQNICRQLIEPVEAELFEALAQKLGNRGDGGDMDIVAVRAFFVHAAVMYRACDGGEAVVDEFAALLDAYIFKNR